MSSINFNSSQFNKWSSVISSSLEQSRQFVMALSVSKWRLGKCWWIYQVVLPARYNGPTDQRQVWPSKHFRGWKWMMQPPYHKNMVAIWKRLQIAYENASQSKKKNYKCDCWSLHHFLIKQPFFHSGVNPIAVFDWNYIVQMHVKISAFYEQRWLPELHPGKKSRHVLHLLCY